MHLIQDPSEKGGVLAQYIVYSVASGGLSLHKSAEKEREEVQASGFRSDILCPRRGVRCSASLSLNKRAG